MSTPFAIENGQTFIRSAFIQDGTITNAKIGDFLQSNNFVPGTQGWRLSKSGTFENNGTGVGGRRVDTSIATRIYYASGQIAVAMGIDI
ncbi:hypothetical protein D3C87_1967510 [compost metagenome]